MSMTLRRIRKGDKGTPSPGSPPALAHRQKQGDTCPPPTFLVPFSSKSLVATSQVQGEKKELIFLSFNTFFSFIL
jgi:hypothetical protein